MNHDNWKYNLREHLSGHEQPEPEGLWEAIEGKIAPARRAAVVPLRRRIFLWAGGVGAAAAVVALALLLTGRGTGTETGPTATVAENTPPSVVSEITEAEVAPEIVQIAPERVPVAPKKMQVDRGGELPVSIAAEEPAITIETTEPALPVETTGPATTEPTTTVTPVKPSIPAEPAPIRSRATGRRGSGWSASILASNIPGSGSRSSRGGYGTLAADAPRAEMYGDEVSLMNTMTEFAILNRDLDTNTETRHRQPVRAGVMVSYALTDRLYIEGGVAYTWLDSRLKAGSDSYYYRTRQSLHYLGVPLGVGCTLWKNRLLNVYVSGGGMVEKCISGSASTEYVDDGNVVSTEKGSVGVDGVQWSVKAATGLQFNISRTVGIFAEPGIGYHFANPSPVETIYKKTPLNFNLTFGLRISFQKN